MLFAEWKAALFEQIAQVDIQAAMASINSLVTKPDDRPYQGSRPHWHGVRMLFSGLLQRTWLGSTPAAQPLIGALDYQLSPRLADIGDARFWRIDRTANYGPLNGLARNRINIDLVTHDWEDMLRLAGSLKLGRILAGAIMRVLQVKDCPTTLARALAELGRIIKTLHMLGYLEGSSIRDADVARVSPLLFKHINFLGRYASTCRRPSRKAPSALFATLIPNRTFT